MLPREAISIHSITIKEKEKKKAEVLTMGKIEDAMKKINAEIQKEPSNRYLALVG